MIKKALKALGLLREVAPVQSPAGCTVEASGEDDAGWRPVSQDARRDLSPIDQTRMQELAVNAWERQRLANRLIELPLAFILGDGVRIEVDDEEAQGWLDAWWQDPINRFDLILEKRMRELALFGEQLIPVFVNPINGHVRHGAIDPGRITRVVMDPDNASLPIGVEVGGDGGEVRTYRVILDGEEAELLRVPALALRAGMTAGDCHFWRVNDLLCGARGRSDLVSAIDLCDAYAQLLFGEVERAFALRTVQWDVTLTGATPDQVEERARDIAPPTPNTVRVHNEAETWAPLSPKLESADAATTLRAVRNEVLGGSTLPEHWYGGGGDVNRATAAEMDEPTYVVFRRRQLFWQAILEAEARHVLRERLRSLGRDWRVEFARPEMKLRAVFPTMKAADVTRLSQALGQIVAACAAAISQGLMTDETALRLIVSIADKMGVEIDAEAELEAAREAARARKEADAFRPPAPDPEGEQGQPGGGQAQP